MRGAGLMGVTAFAALVLASAPNWDLPRQVPLQGPQKLTAGPLLGFAASRDPNRGVNLVRVNPHTLRPSGSKRLRLPFADAWAVAPDGKTLALAVHRHPANEPNSLRVVKLPSLQWRRGSVRLGGDVSALAWISPRRVEALVGEVLCCPVRLSVVVANVQSRHVERRRTIAGEVVQIARSARGLALLAGPTRTIGPASLVVADAHGVRTVELGPIRAGRVDGGGGISKWQVPGLAVDSVGGKAYVAAPDGSVAEVDLSTLAVSIHEPAATTSFLASLAGWFEPTAAAKGDSGPVRHAQWLGDGYMLVAGRNFNDSESQVASDPSGLELIDTHTWTAYNLAAEADSFTVTNSLVLATGSRWRGDVEPTGMGLAAYGPDGKRRFGLFAGRAIWIDHVANGRAYVFGSDWNEERVVDLSTGRVIGTRTTDPVPTLLLGPGDTAGW